MKLPEIVAEMRRVAGEARPFVGHGCTMPATATVFAVDLLAVLDRLDADGLPVVRTVGDLTARHVGRRVWQAGVEFEMDADCLAAIAINVEASPAYADTPCELLP